MTQKHITSAPDGGRTLDAIYLRKSRADAEAEQHGEGETLARHERTLMDLARARGYSIGHIYREVVSGDTLDARPEAQAMLSDVEARKWRAVLVMDADRLARGDTIDQGIVAQTFKVSRTLIITPGKIYDPENEMDEEYFEFGLFMARREYKMIKRRLQAGRVASVREGKYVGSRRPYGYVRVKLAGQKGWTLEIVPDEADNVRAMYLDYLAGVGVEAIARGLNALGARTVIGANFSADTIRVTLRNPIYAGYVQWYKKTTSVHIVDGKRVTSRELTADKHMVVRGLHEPIIDDATFRAVRERFAARINRPLKVDKTLQNPLSGLIFCARCGGALRRTVTGDRAVKILTCPHCTMPGTRVETLEDAVLEQLGKWLADYTPATCHDDAQPRATPENRARQKTEKQLAILRAQREKLYDYLERGLYSESVFVERSRVLDERIKTAESQIAALDAPAPTDEPTLIRALLPQIERVLVAYPNVADAQSRHDLLATVIARIDYAKTQKRTSADPPGRYLSITLHPALPPHK